MNTIDDKQLSAVSGGARVPRVPGMPFVNPYKWWMDSAAAATSATMKYWENWGAWARAGMAGPFGTPPSIGPFY
jgi:hypothetical protein